MKNIGTNFFSTFVFSNKNNLLCGVSDLPHEDKNLLFFGISVLIMKQTLKLDNFSFSCSPDVTLYSY